MTGADRGGDGTRSAGLFVAGTDTGVGKTVVTAAIVRRARGEGIDARGVKPVQTGDDDDAGVVASTCGDPDAATCLGRLDPALAPRVAAERTGTDLSYETVRAGCRSAIAGAGAGVVEGIGGVRVPLADGREVIDLAADLALPAVVVARPALGTLNHTTLTVGALRDRGVPVRGVLLSGYAGETVAERTNPDELRRTLDAPVATLPHVDADDPAAVAGELAAELPAWALPDGGGSAPRDGGGTDGADGTAAATGTPPPLYSVRMHASDGDRHVSGAETLVDRSRETPSRAAAFVGRAFDHPRGPPDEVRVSVDAVDREAGTAAALPVRTVETDDPDESRRVVRQLCRAAGASDAAVEAGLDALRDGGRGAAVIDAATGERLADGVRVSRIGTTPAGDAALAAAIEDAGLGGTQIRDALILATAVVRSGAVAELCWSDDPDYRTGYAATAEGYHRFPRMQEPGDPRGGRAILGPPGAAAGEFVDRLEERPFRVDGAETFETVTPDDLVVDRDTTDHA